MTRALRKGGITLSLIALGILLAGGIAVDSQEASQKMPANSARVVYANTAFGLRLFRELAGREYDHNILISPLGLGMVFAMTYNGAAGETAQEMAEVLELEGVAQDEVNSAYASLMNGLPASGDDLRLDIANSLWADQETSFRGDFLENSRASYRAAIENLDLGAPEAPDIINAWIEEQTEGKIGAVIDKIDRDVVLYIINAMYFEGRWAIPFDTSYTTAREFSLADGSTKVVPAMMAEAREGSYYVGDGFKAACLDYGDGRMSMYLFLPDEDSSLKGFYDRLDSDGWTRWLSGFETGPTLIILPRFSLEYDALLNDALKTLGMRRAFGGADFGRMTSERVFISMVKHNARLEVNEEGTEATSAALVGFKKGPVMRLAFTRPFCLAVVDNTTGAILFIGTVVEP